MFKDYFKSGHDVQWDIYDIVSRKWAQALSDETDAVIRGDVDEAIVYGSVAHAYHALLEDIRLYDAVDRKEESK